ncbi:MAG: quinone-dependent dihydroorotate dehydrogenase [Caulobacterales bacterium]|nr:quinone-dependent dihydroorotate dehydrogenase [Caulobacterales bacterium]
MTVFDKYKFGLFGRALHLLDAETAHNIAIGAFEMGATPYFKCKYDLKTEIAGLELPNPVGFAAGFDKNARIPDELLAAGFGFVECGTVTPLPQDGNPKPRIFRLSKDKAIINAMGFNNVGLSQFVDNLRFRSHKAGIIGSNVGANKDSEDKIADYLQGVRRVWLHSSYIALNISSPNTKGLRDLQGKDALDELLGRVNEVRATQTRVHGVRPLFLKVAPDLSDNDVATIAESVKKAKIDALIVSNTTISRPANLISKYKDRNGGLSGSPLMELSTKILGNFKAELGEEIPLIGVGGIMSGDDAIKKFEAGAKAIQIYTGYIYRGPELLKEIFDAIAEYRGIN